MPPPPDITSLHARPLNVGLRAPFIIASTRLDQVENAAFRIVLKDGTTGWGESAALPPVTAETQADLLSVATQARSIVSGRNPKDWKDIAEDLADAFPCAPSARAGIEMAILDAFAKTIRQPLYKFFGGTTARVTTDITIPICPDGEAESLARLYHRAGFTMIKTKVGLDTDADIGRLRAIRRGHPDCRLILDANEGYAAHEAIQMIETLRQYRIEPEILEQPVAREDWEGLAHVAREAGVPVAADESCRSADDAARIAKDGLAQIINIKLVKSGVSEALKIVRLAKREGIRLMIGGMVETRLAMGFSAHFAAGIGDFEWIDLDTPLLLASDPIQGGYHEKGPDYELSGVTAGHGASPRLDD